MTPSSDSPPAAGSRPALRHDWTVAEIEAIYTAPLPDLVFRAQTVHRAHHRADEVQGCMTSRRRVQIAIVLWIAFAFVAFNALFDFLVVRAGREYLRAAAIAERQGHQHLLIADWMRPAVRRAFAYAAVLGMFRKFPLKLKSLSG